MQGGDDDAFLGAVLSDFPPVAGAFAYGSAIFQQRGYVESGAPKPADAPEQLLRATMTDLVFVVDDAEQWHGANLERHAAHYSGIGRWLGARGMLPRAQAVGAGIYYNQCELHGRSVKYGVISTEALSDDLLHWSSLYVSGRMHKPTRAIVPWPAGLEAHLESNRRAALDASLLLLPARCGRRAGVADVRRSAKIRG